MGMYTELILGAGLKEKTPKSVIDALRFMCGDLQEEPDDFPFYGRINWMFRSGSYYFAVNKGLSKMWYNEFGKNWVISARCNIKNYEQEFQRFLEWLKPHIAYGSGACDFYAIVTYEDGKPEIYYLDESAQSIN